MYNLILIDDEFSTVKMLENYINWGDYGFNLAGIFCDAESALDYIADNPVHAVISDIYMTETNGIEFTKICHQKYPEIVIGFISAYRNFEYAFQAANLNVAGYILKPIVRKDLVEMCKNMANRLNVNNISVKEDKLELKDLQYQFSCQKLLLDMINERITDIDEINQKLKHEHIEINCDMPCVLLEFTIMNYSEHIYTHYITTLYNAINTIVVRNYGDINVLPLLGVSERLIFVAILNDKTLNKLNSVVELIKKNLEFFIEIKVEVDTIAELESFSDLVGYPLFNQNNGENSYSDTINMAISFIRENMEKIQSIKDVANRVHLSTAYFGRLFKNKTGKSFNIYLNEQKIEKSKELLKNKNLTMASIADECGFRNESYFYTMFSKIVGCPPHQYRKKLSDREEGRKP